MFTKGRSCIVMIKEIGLMHVQKFMICINFQYTFVKICNFLYYFLKNILLLNIHFFNSFIIFILKLFKSFDRCVLPYLLENLIFINKIIIVYKSILTAKLKF